MAVSLDADQRRFRAKLDALKKVARKFGSK